jgi:molecular chaperone DnaK
MVQEAEVNAEADKKQRSLIEARNQAEASVHSLRTDMKEVESSLTDEQKTAIEDAIKARISGEEKYFGEFAYKDVVL